MCDSAVYQLQTVMWHSLPTIFNGSGGGNNFFEADYFIHNDIQPWHEEVAISLVSA